MKDQDFYKYLTTIFRGPRSRRALSPKAARDVVSRCRRLKRDLGTDLDKVRNVNRFDDRIAAYYQDKLSSKDLIRAFRLYVKFSGGTVTVRRYVVTAPDAKVRSWRKYV